MFVVAGDDPGTCQTSADTTLYSSNTYEDASED